MEKYIGFDIDSKKTTVCLFIKSTVSIVCRKVPANNSREGLSLYIHANMSLFLCLFRRGMLNLSENQ